MASHRNCPWTKERNWGRAVFPLCTRAYWPGVLGDTGRKGNLLSGRTARDGTYREEGLFPISLRKAENPGTVRNEVDASHSVKE